MNSVLPLVGQVGLVTGGSRGIGRAICVELARAGADVAFSFRNSAREAQETARLIETTGRQPLPVQSDAGEADACRKLVERVLKEWGGVNVVVANAGVVSAHPFESLPRANWDATLGTNTYGPLALFQAAASSLRSRRGRGVIMASIAGLRPGVTELDYHVSKAGAISLAQGLALGLAPEVRVNAVAPGWVETDMNAAEFHDPVRRESIRSETPLGRWGRPEDVAEAVLFLVTEDTRFVTGQVLVVDGGEMVYRKIYHPNLP